MSRHPTPDELDRLIGRALDAEAAAVEPAPDAWERLQHRRHDATSAGSSPAGRGWLLVAAAVVAGVGGLATALTLLTGGDGQVRTASPSAGGTDDASSGTSLDAVSEEAPRPPTALVVTEGGDLLRVDVATGSLERLVPSQGLDGDGGDVPGSDDESDGGGVQDNRIDAAAVGLDDTTFLSTCCEPISGETFVLEPDGDTDRLAQGANPAVGPDGTRVAVVHPAGVAVVGLDGTELHEIDSGSHDGNLVGVAWSPDGERLAVEVAVGATEHRVLLVAAGATSLDEGTELAAPTGVWWGQPVFRPDGSLLVAEHPVGLDDADATTAAGSVVRAVSPDGHPGEAADLGGLAPRRLAADRSGRWVLVAAPTGRMVVIGPDGEVTDVPVRATEEQPLIDVAW